MIVPTFVLPRTIRGITEAFTTRNVSTAPNTQLGVHRGAVAASHRAGAHG